MEGQTCLFYPLLPVAAPSEHGLVAHQPEFSTRSSLPRTHLLPDHPPGAKKQVLVKLCLCLLASFSWCRAGYANTKAVPWCQGMNCSQSLRNEAHILLLTGLFKVGFIFFTVDACEIQCHNICIYFSEVFFMYSAWPLRPGNVSETCMMDCDSAGVFLGKFWEIHLIPALAQPNY